MNRNQLLSQFCGQSVALLNKLIPLSDEKSAAELKTQLASIEKLKAGLPANGEDDSEVVTRAFDLLGQAHHSATQLASRLDMAAQQLASYEARIKSGELLPKEIATEMCTAAEKKATEAAEKKALAEFAAREAAAKLVVERRAALQTAGLPAPESDAILAEAEETYQANRKAAEQRVAAYKDKVPANSKALSRFAWCAAAELPNWEAIVKEIAGNGQRQNLEPLATFSGSNSGGGGGQVVCAV